MGLDWLPQGPSVHRPILLLLSTPLLHNPTHVHWGHSVRWCSVDGCRYNESLMKMRCACSKKSESPSLLLHAHRIFVRLVFNFDLVENLSVIWFSIYNKQPFIWSDLCQDPDAVLIVPHGPRKWPPGHTGQVVLKRTRNRACSTAMLQSPRSGPIPLLRTTSVPQGDYIL
jgi:hypothetical protein